jgi:hypothetical protein
MFKKIKTENKDGANIRKRLTVEELIPGDHIYVRRRGLIYSHHGIYAGERTVINFKGEDKEKRDPTIILTEIKSFLKNGKLRRRNYQKRLPHFESLRIARENLSKKGYSLPFNNCEHFASYCATGKKRSAQVRNVLGGIATITLAVTGAVVQKMITKKRKINL